MYIVKSITFLNKNNYLIYIYVDSFRYAEIWPSYKSLFKEMLNVGLNMHSYIVFPPMPVRNRLATYA